MLDHDRPNLSRRFLIQSGAVLGLSGALSSKSIAYPLHVSAGDLDSLPKPTLRVVAFQGVPESLNNAMDPAAMLDGIVAQVGPVDLIAFHSQGQLVSPDGLATVCSKATQCSSYIALGVAATGDAAPSSVLVGPDGKISAYAEGAANLVCATAVGVIAMSSEATPQFDECPDILIHSAPGRVLHRELGAYTISITAQADEVGSAIYDPSETPLTRTAAGWPQGIVATLDIGKLRRQREEKRLGRV